MILVGNLITWSLLLEKNVSLMRLYSSLDLVGSLTSVKQEWIFCGA